MNRIGIVKETGRSGLVVTVALLGAGLCSAARAEEEVTRISDPKDQINYSVGYEFGGYLAELKRVERVWSWNRSSGACWTPFRAPHPG